MRKQQNKASFRRPGAKQYRPGRVLLIGRTQRGNDSLQARPFIAFASYILSRSRWSRSPAASNVACFLAKQKRANAGALAGSA